ncbi:NUAK family SNF1-like kinase 2 [Podospora fimiseda]|uniref:NUAK family SNF1-like kinase 2 n=1 Tax=Podospora fimiseda TaxID=252190 RepID=A0AAN6YQN9_9PEZI|nr:NUAK family SNF1-like kinase 2 [Podospora fimiseda]
MFSDTLSWNTYLSRTSVSSLSTAAFTNHSSQGTHGLEDVIKAARSLNLCRYRYEELHLKPGQNDGANAFKTKLRAVVLEVQIMHHGPLRAHPNITTAHGYGWNMRHNQIAPYILIEYASLRTLRQYFQLRLAALHKCGIVHGAVKLDNILVFPDIDRPTGALAKVADFGHALILDKNSQDSESQPRGRKPNTLPNSAI